MGRKTGLEAGRAGPRLGSLFSVAVWAGSAGMQKAQSPAVCLRSNGWDRVGWPGCVSGGFCFGFFCGIDL